MNRTAPPLSKADLGRMEALIQSLGRHTVDSALAEALYYDKVASTMPADDPGRRRYVSETNLHLELAALIERSHAMAS